MSDNSSTFKKITGTICGLGAFLFVLAGAKIGVDKASKKTEELNENSKNLTFINFLSGMNRRIAEKEVEKVTIINVIGGTIIDLSDAYITNDMDINIYNVIGGTEIYVPEGVHVMSTYDGAMNGLHNTAPDENGEDIPTVFITAHIVAGGVDIRRR